MGDPAREIDRIARERDADLIVVSHGAPAPLGSVCHKLTHLSPCAMLMLQAPVSTAEATPGVPGGEKERADVRQTQPLRVRDVVLRQS